MDLLKNMQNRLQKDNTKEKTMCEKRQLLEAKLEWCMGLLEDDDLPVNVIAIVDCQELQPSWMHIVRAHTKSLRLIGLLRQERSLCRR